MKLPSWEIPVPEALRELTEFFGADLAARIAGAQSTEVLSFWCKGVGQPPRRAAVARALHLVRIMGSSLGITEARNWFTVPNDVIDGRTPLEALISGSSDAFKQINYAAMAIRHARFQTSLEREEFEWDDVLWDRMSDAQLAVLDFAAIVLSERLRRRDIRSQDRGVIESYPYGADATAILDVAFQYEEIGRLELRALLAL